MIAELVSITLILMGVVLLTIKQVGTMEIITKRVVELRTPFEVRRA